MENRILTNEGWEQRIRDKMGIDIAYLPDSVIQQPDIIGIAEANIIEKVPEYETLDGDALLYLETAVVLECCILLCSSMDARLPKKQTGPHEGHELYLNWENKKTEFIEERNACIGKIYEIAFPEYLSPTLPHFRVTYPKREWQ